MQNVVRRVRLGLMRNGARLLAAGGAGVLDKSCVAAAYAAFLTPRRSGGRRKKAGVHPAPLEGEPRGRRTAIARMRARLTEVAPRAAPAEEPVPVPTVTADAAVYRPTLRNVRLYNEAVVAGARRAEALAAEAAARGCSARAARALEDACLVAQATAQRLRAMLGAPPPLLLSEAGLGLDGGADIADELLRAIALADAQPAADGPPAPALVVFVKRHVDCLALLPHAHRITPV